MNILQGLHLTLYFLEEDLLLLNSKVSSGSFLKCWWLKPFLKKMQQTQILSSYWEKHPSECWKIYLYNLIS